MRDYTKFFTPDGIADFMVKILNPKENDFVLEPSAGNGNLVRAIRRLYPDVFIVAVEINKKYKSDLEGYRNIVIIKDFLNDFYSIPKFCSCIANPPFGNGIDLNAHIEKMLDLIKYNGKLVSIVPNEFNIKIPHNVYNIENWAKNTGGTLTEIKIIEVIKTKIK